MRSALLFLLIVAIRWSLFMAAWFGISRLSAPCQWLVVLAMALFDLIRMTGDRKANRTFHGPLTLVGPLHPWQTPDGSVITRGVPLLKKEASHGSE